MLPKLNINDSSQIERPGDFFSSLGGLHDADVNLLEWDTTRAELIISIDDLYSNFFQTPEYPGKLSVRLKAIGLSALKVEATQGKYPVRILNFKVSQTSSDLPLSVAIIFGEGKIEFECQGIYEENEEVRKQV